nr:hypothetical protein [Tanacetum cinerariifolium]
QCIPSHVVHTRLDREHMDLDVADVSPQPSTEQLDEGFTSMAYPKVQENLKLAVEEQVVLEEPASLSGTLSSLQHLNWAMQAPLCNRFTDLPEADMKEILHQRMWETESHKTHENYKQLFEALEKLMNCDHSEELAQDLAEARKKKKKSHEPSISLTPADLEMNEDMGPDEQAQLSNDEDIRSAHIPKVNLRQDWWKPLEEERPAMPEPAWSIPSSDAPVLPNNWASALASNYSPPPEDSLLVQTGDMATFIYLFCKWRGITELKPQDLEGPAFEIIKFFHPDVIHLQYQMKECHKLLTDSVDDPILRNNISKPLPLGGPPGQVTIQSDFFFNKDLDYLRYGSKGSRPALSISKMKATYYPDVGLKQMLLDQFWIDKECKYDIAAMYGISHWWFQRQRFYIDRHMSEGDRSTVRTHIRILSIVRIEFFSIYGYDYMKKIVLRRADLNEHVIAEGDFKYLYPSDFEDLYLLNLQDSTEPYQTLMGCHDFEYKHDYVVIDSPRAVIFQDKYGVQMMMRFNEIHKFSDGMLQQIDKALDYIVKEFRINRMNPGLNTRFWTRNDVDRCKAFMFAI